MYVSGFRMEVLDSAFIIHDGWKDKELFLNRESWHDLHTNGLRYARFRKDLASKYPGAGRSCSTGVLPFLMDIVQYVVGYV